MFLLFTFSFGGDFYIAGGALLGLEVLGLALKLFDYSPIYNWFKDDNLIDDIQIQADIDEQYNYFKQNFKTMGPEALDALIKDLQNNKANERMTEIARQKNEESCRLKWKIREFLE